MPSSRVYKADLRICSQVFSRTKNLKIRSQATLKIQRGIEPSLFACLEGTYDNFVPLRVMTIETTAIAQDMLTLLRR